MPQTETALAALVLLCAGALAACGGDDESTSTGGSSDGGGGGGGTTAFDVTLTGAVEKGPLIAGSTLEVALLDATAEPLGDVFPTTLGNDLGEFEVAFTHAGPVALLGQGFHYNELTGAVSTSQVTLRALHTITTAGTQQAYVNAITHLTESRVRTLLSGTDLPTAVAQAEQELIVALGIGPPMLNPGGAGIDMSLLGGGSLANAYLFAVSAVLTQVAALEASNEDAVDGELQELMNAIAIDMEDGALDVSRAQLIADGESALLPERIRSLLAARLVDLSSTQEPPDLNVVVDTDHDDIENANDTCPWVANPAQQPLTTDVCLAHASLVPEGTADIDHMELFHLDGDAHLDAMGRVGNDSYVFMAGDGTGVFTTMQTTVIPSMTQRVHFADVNDDGVVDVVAESTLGSLSVYLRSAGFDPLPMPVVSTLSTNANLQPAHGQMDGDSFPELLLMASFFTAGTAEISLPIALLQNDGSGGFTDSGATGTVPNGTSFQGPLAVALTDVTGDAAGDLVLAGVSASGGEAVILTLPGDGLGGLGATVVSTVTLPPSSAMNPGDFALTDVTGDTLVDVVVVGRGNQVATIGGNGDGTFGPAVISNVAASLTGGTLIAMGQLTADALPDLVVRLGPSSSGDLGMAVLPNAGAGSFGVAVTRVARLLGPVDQPIVAGAVGNVDDDGLDELLLAAGPQALMRFGP